MEILHILYDHPDNPWLGGGAALRAKATVPFFLEQGDSIQFVSGGFPGCEKIDGEKVRYSFTPHGGRYVLSRLLFSIKAGSLVRRLKKTRSFDILVEDMSIFNILFPSLFWKGPMVSLVHNYLGKQCFKKLGPLGIIPFLMERHYLKHRKNFIAVSESLKNHILALNPSANVAVVYNGIDEVAFDHPVRENAKKIGFIGRIEINQKGLDILVDALKILKEKGVEFSALMIGGGKDELKVHQMIKDSHLESCVELTGRLESSRFERLSECAVVCMPSRFEGWGIAAIEAAAEGIPVVASNIEGLNEAVVDGRTGVLVENTPSSLAEGILALMQDENRWKNLSVEAREHAKKFRWKAIASSQRNFYLDVVQNDATDRL